MSEALMIKYGWQIADEVERHSSNSADMQYVHKSAYDALKAENEHLRVYKKTIYDYVQCTGNTSPKTLGYHVAEALVMDHKDLKAERDRALAMLEKMAGALEQTIAGLSSFDFEDRARQWATFAPDRQAQHFYEGALMTRTIIREAQQQVLAEYRREFGPQSNVLTKNKLD